MRGLAFPVAGALDDDLVAGVGQPVQGAVGEDGVVEETEPFVDGPVAGDHEAGHPVAADDQLVEVGGLVGREPVQAQVVHDQQVRSQEGPEGSVHRVIHPGLGHGPEEVVGVNEADRMPGPDGGVSQGLGQEALAHSGGPHQQYVLVLGQELQGEDGVQEPTVEDDGRRPVEVLQPAGLLEAGALQPWRRSQPPYGTVPASLGEWSPLLLGQDRGRYFARTGQTLPAQQTLELGVVPEVRPRERAAV